MSPGAERIATERDRQIDVEGYTPEHDDKHEGALLRAAQCYLEAAAVADGAEESLAAVVRVCERRGIDHLNDEDINRQREHPVRHHFGWDRAPDQWPWDVGSWKPPVDATRNLEKAGALIAAEIDRRQRAGATEAAQVSATPEAG